MPKKKKVNPRRIPLAKREIDSNTILNEATDNDIYRAWLLVLSAIMDQELTQPEEIPEIAAEVNKYITGTHPRRSILKDELKRAEGLMGIPVPYENLSLDSIRSPVELEVFKSKIYKVATHTSLCVVCLGLEASGRFDREQLQRLFLHVDLTLAEIDAGITSFGNLEAQLDKLGLTVTELDEDNHYIHYYNS